MSNMTTIDKDYKQRVCALGIFSPMPQNIPQIADDFRAASNWQRGVDGFKFLLMIKIG